jgi:hypothetical protein
MMLREPACEAPFGRRQRQHGMSAGDQKQVINPATTHIWPQASDLQREAAKLDLGDRLSVDKLDALDERDVKRAMGWDFGAGCR